MSSLVRACAVLFTVMWSVSSCATSGTDEAGCGECVEELASVRAEIETLPDVKQIRSLKKYASSPTSGASVAVSLESRSSGDSGVADEVARIIWQSKLSPVIWVKVTLLDASGELVDTNSPFHFLEEGREYATYVDEWGPRPSS